MWNRGGFSFLLAAYPHKDRVLVSLRVTRRSGAAAETLPSVTLRAGDGSRELPVPRLPAERNETVYARAVIPLPPDGRVRADVVSEGEEDNVRHRAGEPPH